VPVTYDVTEGVAIIEIARPEKRNALAPSTFDALGEAAARAGEDDRVGAVLVRGADGTFSSGIDITALGEQASGGGRIDEDFIVRLQGAFTAFEELDVPVVAAIAGPCFGAGLQLALACHVRTVDPTASLSVMEVRWALIPDLGGTHRLPRLVGLGRATELTVTGRRVDAEEAVRIGLAEIAVEDLAEAHALAVRLAAGPGAVRRAPRLLRENLLRGRDEALAAERRTQLACLGGPDFAEAVAAAVEDREPRFTGR
jgi:enoyl-CoA hydratase/carnithine racemase